MSDISHTSSRLSFNGIDRTTSEALRDARQFVLAGLPAVLDSFYNHIARFGETSRAFADRDRVKAVKAAQLRHWTLIMEGRFDDTYMASVTKIGEVHQRMGVELRWYIGGYNVLIASLVDTLAVKMLEKSSKRDAVARCMKAQKAITQAGLLDMDLAVSAYVEAGNRSRTAALKRAAELQQKVNTSVDQIQLTADELNTVARTLASAANSTTERSTSVAAAAEQASGNVHTVAAAAEELSASVKEIARHTSTSGNMSGQAVDNAAQALRKVEQLADAAKKINVIVDLINGIASQTNLLALNATIEAARAGEAGRGFAVVAQEVKALAEQTAKATSEIGRQVTDIQNATMDSVAAIDKITKTIQSMNDIANTIAASVEEQGLATEEIARNVNEAAQGTSSVSSNVHGIVKAASDTGATATKMLNSSELLARHTSELHQAAMQILETLKAA